MAGLIPENLISEVLTRTDIVDLVSSYVPLEKKSSANLFGLCPFHEEETPSFSVAPRKQIFYCFGCHKGGNAIKFIQEIEHLSFPDAVRFLAKRVNLEIPENDDPQLIARQRARKRLLAIMLDAARFYYSKLLDEEGLKARYYLEQRTIHQSVAKRFGLGFAPAAWDQLCQHLQSKGYTQEEMLTSGLAIYSRQKTLIDFFRNRITFPIFDVQGNLIAFGGRALDESGPKYLNTNETAIYHKGKHLYGLNFAKSSQSDRIVIVEGYFDVISLYLAGIDYAAATLGTALTSAQANLLKRHTDRVITCFDADRAGRNATSKATALLERVGIEVSVLLIPENKDPDDYVRAYGPARFKALLDNVMEPLAFELEMIRQEFLSENGVLQILGYQNLACNLLAKEKNAILREIYAAKVAAEIGTTTKAVMTEIARRRNPDQNSQDGKALDGGTISKTGARAKDISAAKEDEIQLIILLSEFNDLLTELDFVVEPEDFSAGLLRKVASKLFAASKDGSFSTANLPGIIEESIGSDGDRDLANSLMEASINSIELTGMRQKRAAIERLFHRLRSGRFDREGEALLAKAKAAVSASERAEYLTGYKELQTQAIKWKQKLH